MNTQKTGSPLLDTADAFLAAGEFDKAIAEATPYLQSTDSAAVSDAHRIIALSYFRLGKYAQSQEQWEAKVKDTGTWLDWFNLTTTSAMNNDVARSKIAFDTMEALYDALSEIDKKQTGLSMINIVYYYMRSLLEVKQYDMASHELEKIRLFYEKLSVTDRTFVVGATESFPPSLGEVLEAVQPIFDSWGAEKTNAWLTAFAAKLDDEGKQMVESCMMK